MLATPAHSIEPPSIVTRAAREGIRLRGIQQGLEGRRCADAPLLPPGAVPPGREPAAPADRPELARVDAELLDQLLNNSGEASIARARLEQQIGSIDFNVGELSRTVTRLKEQLRKLELETEAQILHRYEEERRPEAAISIRSSSTAIPRSSSSRAASPKRPTTSAAFSSCSRT